MDRFPTNDCHGEERVIDEEVVDNKLVIFEEETNEASTTDDFNGSLPRVHELKDARPATAAVHRNPEA